MKNDPISLEDLLKDGITVPFFEEAKNIDEIKYQLDVVGTEIDKCQKIIEHLTISEGVDSREVDKFMTLHIQLLSLRKKLLRQHHEITDENNEGLILT